MQTTVESQPSPRVPAPDAPATAGDGGALASPSSTPAERRDAVTVADEGDATRDGAATPPTPAREPRPREIGGRDGPEPTRFGDWEKAGRCIDF